MNFQEHGYSMVSPVGEQTQQCPEFEFLKGHFIQIDPHVGKTTENFWKFLLRDLVYMSCLFITDL